MTAHEALTELVQDLQRRADACTSLARTSSDPTDANRLWAAASAYDHAAELAQAALDKVQP